MRILVLRSPDAAPRTAARLAALGHTPVLLPLARARHDAAALEAGLAAPHAAIVLTSAEAAAVLRSRPDLVERHRDATLFAVGHATAAAAREAGFRSVTTPGSDGWTLAGFIDARRPAGLSADAPLLYLAGFPRSPPFERRLAELDVPHHTVECYRMEPIAHPPGELERRLSDPRPDAVLFHSRESVRRFFALPPLAGTPERIAGMRLFCISANVADAVPPGLATAVAIADAPDEESLLALLAAAPPVE